MESELVVYEFTRSNVERCDFSTFIKQFGPESLPQGRKLRMMMNSFLFSIGGYDNDQREIYSIPEIREFYRKFHAAWPYWLYFCRLDDSDGLRNMMFCRLDSFASLHVEGSERIRMEYEGDELAALVTSDFAAMNQICKRAEMFERMVETRRASVLEYFRLPLDFHQ